jgi:hypothetical protein
MTLHLHFTLKISGDLFSSLDIKLSAQPSFEIFKTSGFVFCVVEEHGSVAGHYKPIGRWWGGCRVGDSIIRLLGIIPFTLIRNK